MNFHLKNSFYPDINIQEKEFLSSIELEEIYTQIIGAISPENKKIIKI